MACHDVMRNEVTIAAPFRVVAAETGGVAAHTPETAHAPGGLCPHANGRRLAPCGLDHASALPQPVSRRTRSVSGMCRFGTRCCTKSSLPRQKFEPHRNPFDCVSPRAVRSGGWALGSVAMLEAVTALFGIMSAGIFIAHAVDGYRSRA